MTTPGSQARPTTRLAWVLFCVAMSFVLASMVVAALHLDAATPVWGVRGAGAIWAVAFGVVGALLAARVARNPIGWIFLSASLLEGFMNLAAELALAPTARGGVMHPTWLHVTSWAWIPVAALFSAAMVLFPDGRPASRRWRWFLYVFGAATIAFTITMVMQPAAGSESSAWLGSGWLGIVAGTWQLLALISMSSIIWRRRHAGPVERLQLRWVVSAALAIIVMIAFVELGGTLRLLNEEVYLAATSAVSLTIPLLPIAIGIAVMRYRLYAIDRILTRTAVYGLVTATLVGLYLAAVLLLQVFFTTQSGQLPNLVVAVTTLVVAAAFHPVRLRAQRIVDRRFNRRLSDAARVLENFGHALRDEVDLDAVATHLRRAATDTVQPAAATVWVRNA